MLRVEFNKRDFSDSQRTVSQKGVMFCGLCISKCYRLQRELLDFICIKFHVRTQTLNLSYDMRITPLVLPFRKTILGPSSGFLLLFLQFRSKLYYCAFLEGLFFFLGLFIRRSFQTCFSWRFIITVCFSDLGVLSLLRGTLMTKLLVYNLILNDEIFCMPRNVWKGFQKS